ncbi:unnamed protein product [Ilex paraguariensis]|uniref:Uncharacterized protein n=1 Tax=Ilex paraguariensis TaxID=185542 RepID=A0ABC8TEJ2_9AQUA
MVDTYCRSEVLSVVIRPSNQLKITFLEKDNTDVASHVSATCMMACLKYHSGDPRKSWFGSLCRVSYMVSLVTGVHGATKLRVPLVPGVFHLLTSPKSGTGQLFSSNEGSYPQFPSEGHVPLKIINKEEMYSYLVSDMPKLIRLLKVALRCIADFDHLTEDLAHAKDITDLGSLKEAAKIFVPGGATLYSARTIKIKEDEGFMTYYFYEFGRDEQHVALVAAVNSGKAYIAGAAAPRFKWDADGVKLRSAAVSLTVL